MQENHDFMAMWADSMMSSGSFAALAPQETPGPASFASVFSNSYVSQSEGLDQRDFSSPTSSPRFSHREDPITAAISLLDSLPSSDGPEAPSVMPMDPSLFESNGMLSEAPTSPHNDVYMVPARVNSFLSVTPPVLSTEVSCGSHDSMLLQTSEEYAEMAANLRGNLSMGPSITLCPTALFFLPEHDVPDRINATSPSRLATRARPGANFTVAVQLVAKSPATGGYVAAVAPYDMRIRAQIWGKRRLPKKLRHKKAYGERAFVPLTTNPEGNPLLVSGASNAMACSDGYVDVVVKQGTDVATFNLLSLTCGSNAARSSSASAAARAWDWEYHLLVSQVLANGEQGLRPVMSRHITTDSNRSLTREKRKASDDGQPQLKKSCTATEELPSKQHQGMQNMQHTWCCP